MAEPGTKRGRSDSDDYSNEPKRLRTNPNIPLRGQCSNRAYADLIKSSTKKFRSKHLITDGKNRQQLEKLCRSVLDQSFSFTTNDPLCRPVNQSSQGVAKTRLNSLLKKGHFAAGKKVAKRNTIVVSASEKILLHIEKSNHPRFHLWVWIEQTNRLNYHLVRNNCGKVCHYRK